MVLLEYAWLYLEMGGFNGGLGKVKIYGIGSG